MLHGSSPFVFCACLCFVGSGCRSTSTANASSGGTSGTGGQIGTGGSVSGGTSGTGGQIGTGGSVSGGTVGTGGRLGTGGLASGGTSGTGGRLGTGGSSSGGGTVGSGGVNTGGSTTGGNGAVFTVDYHLASDEDSKAPGTIGIVTWSVALGAIDKASIEFGLDTTYGTTAPVDLSAAGFRTLLLGMKPSHTYHFRIVAESGGSSYTSEDYAIDTGPPTTLLSLGAFTVHDEAARERGFIVTSYWVGEGASGNNSTGIPFIIDADGDIVWWYQSSSSSIARARMSEDGKNMWMVISGLQGGPVERVSMDTLDGQVYTSTVGSHDITPVKGELMAYLDYSESDCNSIFEIDPSGRTVEVFESQDYVSGGGCHSNALRYSRKEDVYTFSDHHQDIFIVNRSGGVDWRLSDIVSGGNSSWGGAQHGHHLLDDGILIFANSGGSGNVSAAIEYALDGTERVRYASAYKATNLGDVQRLPGGNTLITYSTDSVIQEIDSNQNLVLQISGGGSRIGYAVWRESLYGAPPDLDQ